MKRCRCLAIAPKTCGQPVKANGLCELCIILDSCRREHRAAAIAAIWRASARAMRRRRDHV